MKMVVLDAETVKGVGVPLFNGNSDLSRNDPLETTSLFLPLSRRSPQGEPKERMIEQWNTYGTHIYAQNNCTTYTLPTCTFLSNLCVFICEYV